MSAAIRGGGGCASSFKSPHAAMAVSDSEALAAVLAVAGAEFDGLAGNLESARNVLISGLGTAMHSAKGKRTLSQSLELAM